MPLRARSTPGKQYGSSVAQQISRHQLTSWAFATKEHEILLAYQAAEAGLTKKAVLCGIVQRPGRCRAPVRRSKEKVDSRTQH